MMRVPSAGERWRIRPRRSPIAVRIVTCDVNDFVAATPISGPAVSGALLRIDNYSVSLRDASGDYRSFSRVTGVTVDVRDPLVAHRELLDHYTDDAIHDVVAYLWTIK